MPTSKTSQGPDSLPRRLLDHINDMEQWWLAGKPFASRDWDDLRDAASALASPPELVQAAQQAVDFLGSCEWNDHTSETDASDIGQRLQDAITSALASKPQKPDVRGIIEALGFDPTNHHNALACPYCNPKGSALASPPAHDKEAK